MEFSFSALTNWLSPAISVGCGLKTNSISFNVIGSEGPSPSVSVCSVRSLDSLSSLLSEVKLLFGRFPKDLLMELTFEETGLGGWDGVLRPDCGAGLGSPGFGFELALVVVVDVVGGVVVVVAVVAVVLAVLLGAFCYKKNNVNAFKWI